jgi:hypothetical protein
VGSVVTVWPWQGNVMQFHIENGLPDWAFTAEAITERFFSSLQSFNRPQDVEGLSGAQVRSSSSEARSSSDSRSFPREWRLLRAQHVQAALDRTIVPRQQGLAPADAKLAQESRSAAMLRDALERQGRDLAGAVLGGVHQARNQYRHHADQDR